MTKKLIDILLNSYIKYEFKKAQFKSRKQCRPILPNYVTNRKIVIYNNGRVVFDSTEYDEIPDSIKYTIKCYGIPKNLKINSKTPLIYRVNTTLSSIFPSKEIEIECINSLKM